MAMTNLGESLKIRALICEQNIKNYIKGHLSPSGVENGVIC